MSFKEYLIESTIYNNKSKWESMVKSYGFKIIYPVVDKHGNNKGSLKE